MGKSTGQRKKEKSAGTGAFYISANTIGKLHSQVAKEKGNKLMISADAAHCYQD